MIARTFGWVLGLLSISLVAGCVALSVLITDNVTVTNNRSVSYWITGCDEIGTLNPGESEEIHAIRACSVFRGGTYVGCLEIPRGTTDAKGEVMVSEMRTDWDQPTCARARIR